MSEWISFINTKPKDDTFALVTNNKGWMGIIKAYYHTGYDVWVLEDPNYRQTITLEVTHYLPIPELEKKIE